MRKSIFFIVLLAFTLVNCARIGSPTGGSKDSIAPVMAIANPANKSTLFKRKKITIHFDEYIRFKRLNTQLIISPPMEKKPIIKPQSGVAKKISVEFLENLKPNTTYTINFGNSIVDNNEGNELGNFSYVFATGKVLDSLYISGKILDPLSKEKVETISVMAYKNKHDSLVGNGTPDYLSNTLNSDEYSLENLPEGSYKIIALEDKNNNYKYDKGIEKIAFLNQQINLKVSKDTINFILFKEPKDDKIFRPIQKNENLIIIGYQGENTPTLEVKGLEKKAYFISKTQNKDSLYFWMKQFPTDSLYLKIKQDTLINNFTLKPRKLSKDSLVISKNTNDILHPNDTLTLNTNIPIKTINNDSIQLFIQDSILVPFQIINNAKKQSLNVIFKRKTNQNYTLELKETAFKDILKNTNKKQVFKFKTLDNEEYGELVLNITNVKNHNLIVEVINSKLKISYTKIIHKTKTIRVKNLSPDDYTVSIVKDLNNNNIKDRGNFKMQKQPEPIYRLNKKITLRANSEINENITIK